LIDLKADLEAHLPVALQQQLFPIAVVTKNGEEEIK
jgi:hypothetical protein